MKIKYILYFYIIEKYNKKSHNLINITIILRKKSNDITNTALTFFFYMVIKPYDAQMPQICLNLLYLRLGKFISC